MYRWKVAGAPHSPNGQTVHSNSPYLVRNAVFSSWPSAILILWKAAVTSNLVKRVTPARLRSVSVMSGRGYLSFFVIAFNAR